MVKRSAPPQVGREQACMIHEGGEVYCIDPLEAELAVLSKRWTLLVIGVLGNGKAVRFNEAKRTIPGISARALSDVLTALQERDLARRDVDTAETPPAVRYSLTRRGRALRRALIPLVAWASQS